MEKEKKNILMYGKRWEKLILYVCLFADLFDARSGAEEGNATEMRVWWG
jgi:hypothetical protein